MLHQDVVDCEQVFIQALGHAPLVKMLAGRSNSSFFQTLNRQFIIKSLKQAEMADFTDPTFAHNYFKVSQDNDVGDCVHW